MKHLRDRLYRRDGFCAAATRRLLGALCVCALAVVFGAPCQSARGADALSEQRGRGEPVLDEQGKRVGTWAGVYAGTTRYSLDALVGLKLPALEASISFDEKKKGELFPGDRSVTQEWINEVALRELKSAGIATATADGPGSDCQEKIVVCTLLVPDDKTKTYILGTYVFVGQSARLLRAPRPIFNLLIFGISPIISAASEGGLAQQVEHDVHQGIESLATAFREANRASLRTAEVKEVVAGSHPPIQSYLFELVTHKFPAGDDEAQRKQYQKGRLSSETFEQQITKSLRDGGIFLRWPHSQRQTQAKLWLGIETIRWHPADESFRYAIESTISEPAELLRLPTTFVYGDCYRFMVTGGAAQSKAEPFMRETFNERVAELSRIVRPE